MASSLSRCGVVSPFQCCASEASFPGASRRLGAELTTAAQQLLQEMANNPQLPPGTLDALATQLQDKPYALAFLGQGK